MTGIRVLVRDSGGVLALDFPTAAGWRVSGDSCADAFLIVLEEPGIRVAQFKEWIGVSQMDDAADSEEDEEK